MEIPAICYIKSSRVHLKYQQENQPAKENKMRITATANGLKVTEPQVVAKINGNAPTSPKPLSEVVARYGKHIDFDTLRTIGHQTVHIGTNVVVFEFTR